MSDQPTEIEQKTIEDKPGWFKGIITGGKESKDQDTP